MRAALRCASLLAAGLAVAGCGGEPTPASPGGTQMRMVRGAAVKGPLVGATISFFHVDAGGHATGEPIATAITDELGHVTTGLPQSTQPLLAVSSGGSYVDESDDAGGEDRRRITLAADEGFEAIVAPGVASFSLTPYSMAILLRARRFADGSNFLPIYQVVREHSIPIFGFDPTTVIPADPLAPSGDAAAIQYALLLGGAAYAINTIAANLGVTPSYPIVRAFIDDLSDGKVDGLVADDPIQVKATIPDVDLNGEILRFRNNHFSLYGNTLITLDEDEWSIDPPLPPNLPPVALADAIVVDEGGTASELVGGAESVLDNDSDPGDASLSATLITPPGHGTLTFNADGTFEYEHDGTESTSDSFTYRAFNGAVASNLATVAITITPVNQPPIALEDHYVGAQGVSLIVVPPGVLFNDVDPEGATLIPELVQQPEHGTLQLNENGSFNYTAPAGFVGEDFFAYRVSDGQAVSDTVTVHIQITPGNHEPIAQDDLYHTVQDSNLAVIAPGVLANDMDADGDPLEVILVSPPAAGTLVLTPQGSFSYSPPSGFTGLASFQYRVSDGVAQSNVATVRIRVAGGSGGNVNHAPIAQADTFVWTGGTLSVPAPGVLANDSDPDGDPISAQLVSPPTQGTLNFNADGGFTYEFGISDKAQRGKSLGSDEFSYRVTDGQLPSSVVTVKINLQPNQAPSGVADAYTVDFGGTLTVAAPGVLDNDSDPDGDPITAQLVSDATLGNLTLNANGSFSYTHVPPPPSKALAKAALQDQFTYRVSDGDLQSEAVTVTIKVNRAPFGNGDSYTVNAGGTLTIAAPGVLGNDGDIDGDSITAVPDTGTTLGTLTLNADGSFQYQNTGAGSSDQFTYRVDDGALQSSLITVTITINNPPTGSADSHSADLGLVLVEGAPGVLDNDSDPDGDSITAVLETAPTKGTLNLDADGSFMYQPFASSSSGTDQFTYRVSDGQLQSAPVTVTINLGFFCDCSPPSGRFDPVVTQDGLTVVFLSEDEDRSLDPDKTTFTDDIFVTTFNPLITAGKRVPAKASVEGGVTIRLLTEDGTEPDGSVFEVNVTPDGHYVVFSSTATNFQSGVTAPGTRQVYRYSLMSPDAGEVVLVSADPNGGFSDNFNQGHAISDDGRYVAFDSFADNLTGISKNGVEQVYLRDITGQTTSMVSIDWQGSEAVDSGAFVSSISGDGKLVSFSSNALDVVPPDFSQLKAFTNGFFQVYVRNVAPAPVAAKNISPQTTVMVSVDSQDNAGTGDSFNSWLSPDGSMIVFQSQARNLVANDNTSPAFVSGIFLHNISNVDLGFGIGETVRVSRGLDFTDPDGTSFITVNAFSADNQFVSFVSLATNIVEGDTNEAEDVFVHSLVTGEYARANVAANGDQAVSGSQSHSHALSADGTKIGFSSNAINLEDPRGEPQVYVLDNPLTLPAPKSRRLSRRAPLR